MTGQPLAVPPGRAGRLWLARRLAAARDGADLLDRKLAILDAEAARCRSAAAAAAERWEQAQRDARTWLLRAAMLGGQRALRLGEAAGPAELTVSYAVTMGIRYPARADVAIPPSPEWAGQALRRAREAHAAALRAAAGHAAARTALRVMEDEAAATRYRMRALRHGWVPRLEAALAEVTLAIEEQEQADAARLRRAGRRSRTGHSVGP